MAAAVQNDTMNKEALLQDDFKVGGTLIYTVRNFSKITEEIDIYSPSVMIRGLSWRLYVSPYYESDGLGFFLECDSIDSNLTSWTCKADVTMKIKLQKEGVVDAERKFSHLFESAEKNWGFLDFRKMKFLMDPINGYIKDDAVTFEINFLADEPKGLKFKDKFALDLTLPKHLEKFKLTETEETHKSLNQRLFEAVLNTEEAEKCFSHTEEFDPDQVILKSYDGALFNCSRKILAMQSWFWRKPFTDGSTKCDVEVVEDFDEATLTEVLRFVYTEKCDEEKLDACVISCLEASKKYGIPLLKEYCSFILRRKMNVENAVSFLLLAEKCEDSALLNFATKFISQNLYDVRNSEHWREISTSFESIDSIFGLMAGNKSKKIKLK